MSDTGPEGPLVVCMCVCVGGGDHAGEGYTVCGSHMGLAFGCIWIALQAVLANDLWLMWQSEQL